MKLPLLSIALILLSSFAFSDEDREFSRKTLELSFDSAEKAHKWSLSGLGFADWLEAVSQPGWIELFRSESEEFYFAIYRRGDHLIFCENDRKKAYRGGAISVKATDAGISHDVAESPSMWSTLKWQISYPSGSFRGQENFTTWKIRSDFSGDIILKYSVKNDGSKYRQVLLQKVSWSKKAEQAEA